MKLVLKAPGTMRLKLHYDNLLSNFAFKSNLRRCGEDKDDSYTFCDGCHGAWCLFCVPRPGSCMVYCDGGDYSGAHADGGPGEAVQVEPMESTLKAPGTKRLKLKYDNLLSSFAFKFNLRRYTPV